jgi:D-amino-acid dehydrogenase
VEVIIIGGGVIGLSQALDLAHNNVQVTVLDARSTDGGASAVNAGWVVPAEAAPVPGPGMIVKSLRWMLHADSPLYIRPSLNPRFLRFMFGMSRHCNESDFRRGLTAQLALAEDTMERVDEYVSDGVSFEMHDRGLLMAFMSQQYLEHYRETLDVAASFGLEPQILTRAKIREQEPALSDQVCGGIFFPHERHVDPVTLHDGLRTRCQQLGVRVISSSRVDQVERSGSAVVAIRSGERRLTADRYLLAAGAWSGPLSRLFGVPLPVWPGKGYAVDLAPPPVPLRSMVKLCDAMVASTPLNSRLRLAGTMEFGGFDEKVNSARVGALLAAGRRYFRDWPSLDPKPEIGVGIRPMTPDGLPLVGRLGELSNCYVSTGHGMLGITLAASTARALTPLILGTAALSSRLQPFDAARFG